MEFSLKTPNWDRQQDHLSSTPLKKPSFSADDKKDFSNSFLDSPLMDKEKISRHGQKSKDEFWDALSSNYDYLMDDGLIATCREASSDLSLDDEQDIPESYCWSFARFIEQFKSLHDLLHHLQVEKQESESKVNPAIVEEQQNIAYLCKLFNEQAKKLSKRYPDMRDEIHRHLNLLNNKWEAVEQSIILNKGPPSKDGAYNEITNRMRFLRKALADFENRLSCILEYNNWSLEGLQERIRKQQILQQEIQAIDKFVTSLVKLCEHLEGNICFGQNALPMWNPERVRRVVTNLQNRLHSIWIKSLECHFKLEESLKTFKTGNNDKLEKSFSEEPVKKYPRLSDTLEDNISEEDGLKSRMSFKSEESLAHNFRPSDLPLQQQNGSVTEKDELTPKNDKAVMVGDTSIIELKAKDIAKFEIVQDIGYSSETSVHCSMDEKTDIDNGAGLNKRFTNKNSVACVQVMNGVCPNEQPSQLYLAPDKYPSFTQKTWKEFLVEDQNIQISKYNSFKSVPDEFYKVTSIDVDVFEDVPETAIYDNRVFGAQPIAKKQTSAAIEQMNVENQTKIMESVEKFMPQCSRNYTSTTKEKLSSPSAAKPNILTSSNSPSNTIQRKKRGSKSAVHNCSPKPARLNKHSDRVVEWLSTCRSGEDLTSDDNIKPPEKQKIEWQHKDVIDSSCDASNEYTSDSERSGVSDDVNNSVSFSQSFTGSIETVIPAETVANQCERAGSAEPSPFVRMRNKKKRIHHDRPWSVTEDTQRMFPRSLMPHSTSEGALEKLLSSTGRKTSCAKKFCFNHKRRSMTDISFNCPIVELHYGDTNLKTTVQSGSGSEKPSSQQNNSVSEKSSDNYDTALCVTSENSSQSLAHDKKHVHECMRKSLTGEDNTSAEELEKFEINTTLTKQTYMDLSLASGDKIGCIISTDDPSSAVNAEDHGSLSDQAWDEYQDPPYLSEPYSEQTADEDELKKLTNFGEDYRTILGSYSDTSSICARVPPMKHYRRSSRSRSTWKKSRTLEDNRSDSDSEDLQNILATSRHALQFVSNNIKENTQKFSELSSEFDELVATCQVNLCNLHEIHEELLAGGDLEAFSKEDIAKLENLINEWDLIQVRLLSTSKTDKEQKPTTAELEASEKDVRCAMGSLKGKLSGLESKASQIEKVISSLESLDDAIRDLQAGLTNLQELKQPVFSIRAKIHGLRSGGGGPTIVLLHDDANKLYQQWENVYEIICSQLTKMQTLRSEWHQSTQNEIVREKENDSEWKPIQAGITLPKREVSKENLHPIATAEIMIADLQDILMNIETAASFVGIQQTIVDKPEGPALCTNPPTLRKSVAEKKAPPKTQENRLTTKPTRSRLWRMLKTALPIQLAIVLLYWMSCLMEPQCCEYLNNYDFSVLPQLRYIRGPPPV